MKAVNFVMLVLFVVLFSGKPVWAFEFKENTQEDMKTEELTDQVVEETGDNSAAFAESAVNPYEGFVEANDAVTAQVDALASDSAAVEPAVVDTANELVSGTMDAVSESAETVQESLEAVPATDPADEAENASDTALLDAVKADIKERSKATGKLDLYDGAINKVRTLDLIEYKSETAQEGDATVVYGDFRDTTTGDLVTLNIHVVQDNGVYGIKDMVIASVKKPEIKETKDQYTDEEVKSFIKEYIETQSQATGSFDLYDEKAKKMRNLQYVSLDEKLRRYGIIAISTAEFTDKNTGDVVKVDVNTENKNGLSVTAMRLKSVSKPAVKE